MTVVQGMRPSGTRRRPRRRAGGRPPAPQSAKVGRLTADAAAAALDASPEHDASLAADAEAPPGLDRCSVVTTSCTHN